MRKNIFFIAKLSCAVRDINENLSKYFNIHISSPEKEMITMMLKEIDVDIILIYLPDSENLKFVYVGDAIEYAKQRRIPIVTIGAMSEYKILNKGIMKQISEVLYKPITVDGLLEVLKKHLKIDGFVEDVIENQRVGDTRKHLLLVDDAGFMLRSLKAILSDEYQVYLANSAVTALQSIGRKKPDAILLDYEMPIYDGKQTFEMLRVNEETKDIPVFFITGVSNKEKIKAIMALKPQGYLLKPLERNVILDTLEKFFISQNRSKKR